MMLKEKMIVQYKNMTGKIVFVGSKYVTFNPNDTAALLLIYRENWNDVTVL